MSVEALKAPAFITPAWMIRLRGWTAGHPTAAAGLALVVFWILVALAAPILPLRPPHRTYTPLLPPMTIGPDGGLFLLGADHMGRDLLSRTIWGARRVLIYAPVAVGSAYVIGGLGGAMAGYLRGWVDEALSRLADLIMSLPALPLFVVAVSMFGASPASILGCIVVAKSPRVLRLVRGLVIEAREAGYVQAARMRGESSLYIVLVEILPNVKGPLLVDACVSLGYVIVAIGALGFLGLGLPPPDANWGTMIAQGREVLIVAPHVVLVPCVALLSFVVGCNLLADGLKPRTAAR